MEHGIWVNPNLVTALVTVIMAGGVGIGFILRSVFVTKKSCKEEQYSCQHQICAKMEDVKVSVKDLEIKIDTVEKNDNKMRIWLVESLTKMAQQQGVNIEPMPK